MKNDKNKINQIINSILVIIYGVNILVNAIFDTRPITNSIGNWYETLILLFACLCLSNMIMKKAPQYIMLIVFFTGLYLFLHISRTNDSVGYWDLWPMFFLSIGLGIVTSYIATKKESGFLKTGLTITIVSALFLWASLTDNYGLAIPSLVIVVGIALFVSALQGKEITNFKSKPYHDTDNIENEEGRKDEK